MTMSFSFHFDIISNPLHESPISLLIPSLGIMHPALEIKDLLTAKPKDLVVRAKITEFLLELHKNLSSHTDDGVFKDKKRRQSNAGSIRLSVHKPPSSSKGSDSFLPEWVDTVKRMQVRRLQRKVKDHSLFMVVDHRCRCDSMSETDTKVFTPKRKDEVQVFRYK